MNRAVAVVLVTGALGIAALVFWVTDAERRAADWEAKAGAAEHDAEYAKLVAAIFGLAYRETVNVQAINAETRKLVAALYGLPANRQREDGDIIPLPAQDGVEPDVDLDFGDAPPNPPGSVIVWERKKTGALVFHFKDPAALTAAERARVVSVDEMKAMAREEWSPKKRKKATAPVDEDGAIPAGAGEETGGKE